MAKIRDRWHPAGLDHLDKDTDRYRLLAAFENLGDDWLVWGGASCCQGCSGRQVREEEPDFKKAIYWHSQDEDCMYGEDYLLPEHEAKMQEIWDGPGEDIDKDRLCDEYLMSLNDSDINPWEQSDEFLEGTIIYMSYTEDPTEVLAVLEEAGFHTYWDGDWSVRIVASLDPEVISRFVERE